MHQRIYDNHVSLARVGINVRGRSKRLTVNYRTTQEILQLAVSALGQAVTTGRDAELDALVQRIRGWREEGIEPHAIGIAARSSSLGKQATAALQAEDIQVVSLSARTRKNAVRVGTMHGMKGLEFQAVAVIAVADGTVPAPSAVTPPEADPVAHAQDLQRERCLLFVALTRARDHLYISYSGSPSAFLS